MKAILVVSLIVALVAALAVTALLNGGASLFSTALSGSSDGPDLYAPSSYEWSDSTSCPTNFITASLCLSDSPAFTYVVGLTPIRSGFVGDPSQFKWVFGADTPIPEWLDFDETWLFAAPGPYRIRAVMQDQRVVNDPPLHEGEYYDGLYIVARSEPGRAFDVIVFPAQHITISGNRDGCPNHICARYPRAMMWDVVR